MFCKNWTLVVFIQLAPVCVTKPCQTVASRFKPEYPTHAQNCSYSCKMIINTFIDGKSLTSCFIFIKLIVARNYPTWIVRKMILTRNIHAGGFVSLQSNCLVCGNCTSWLVSINKTINQCYTHLDIHRISKPARDQWKQTSKFTLKRKNTLSEICIY